MAKEWEKKYAMTVVCIFFTIICKWKTVIKLSWFVNFSKEVGGKKPGVAELGESLPVISVGEGSCPKLSDKINNA